MNRVNILLVEDSSGDALWIARQLRAATDRIYELCHVELMQDAVAKLADPTIDVVLLDLHLPDSSGLETVERAAASAPNRPIVVLTGLDDADLAAKTLRGGAQDYLIKGQFDTDTLVRSMRYAIERKRTEELRNKLFHADRLAAIGQLAAGVAHEINNPADFILSNLSLMGEYIDSLETTLTGLLRSESAELLPDAKRALAAVFQKRDTMTDLAELKDMIRDNSAGMERIRSIVGDLRTFSRIERDEVEPLDINEIVNVACNLAKTHVRHRALLVKDLQPVPEIVGDRAKLSQALVNLLVNAAQSIEEGAADRNEVRVTTRLVGDRISIIIEDTGCGISEKHQRLE